MNKLFIIQCVIVSATLIFYFIFTIRYFFRFKKNSLFSGWLKTFHLMMIWLIPFIWILLLKALTKSTPGSYEIEKKEDPESFSKSAYGGIYTSS